MVTTLKIVGSRQVYNFSSKRMIFNVKYLPCSPSNICDRVVSYYVCQMFDT